MDDPKRPLLEVESVSKSFGRIDAVTSVSLTVGPGELFALLGASGSGKTTLLRLVAGLERPDSGRIRIGGQDMTDTPAYERPVNTVFQSYALFPHMSVRANIAFGLRQERLPRKEIASRVDQMLDLVQMSAFADRRPHQLSGGQKQRVALARSLAKLPKLLLLDEPMSALDRKLREQTRLELAAIQKRIGIAFVLVTHDQDEAMSLADRMAVMEAGRIAQIGTPREIYEAPQTRFVADFIGSANLFEGQAAGWEDGLLEIRVADQAVRVRHEQRLADGQVVWIAVRPEKLRLSGTAEPGENRLGGVVRGIEYFGDMSVVHVETGAGTRLRATVPHRERGPSMPESGAAVTLSWSPDSGVVLTR